MKKIAKILIKRIPFLKEYNIFKTSDSRLEAQRMKYNSNISFEYRDGYINFEQFNIFSEVIYYSHKVFDNVFLGFKELEKKYSYNKELMLKEFEIISKEDLDNIINDMNGTLFKIEEFTKKYSINLF